MTAPQASPTALREVRRGVAEAGDAQVLQVVRMVDAMEIRGATDAVLAPVRSRLRAMQPARPLRFARLLFMPADPLIVPPAAWRAGGPQLPRHAVPVLAEGVRSIIGAARAPELTRAALAEVDGLIKDRMTSDVTAIRRAGALLWPIASRALLHLAGSAETPEIAACKTAWREQALPEAEFQPLALSVSCVLAFALKLHDAQRIGGAPSASVLSEALAAAEALGKRAGGMMLSLWLIRAPQSGGQLLEAPSGVPPSRLLCEAATEAALGWLEAESHAAPALVTPSAAEELNRHVSLLDALATQPGDSSQRRRIAQLRASLLEQAVQRFDTSLRETVESGLRRLPVQAAQRDAALNATEAGTRMLHGFELEARRLGGGGKFAALILRAEASLREAESLSLMDRARLLELLAGPEAAIKLLQAK